MSVQGGNNNHLRMKTIYHNLEQKQYDVYKLKQIIEDNKREIKSLEEEIATWKSYSVDKELKIHFTKNNWIENERKIQSLSLNDELSHETFNAIYDELIKKKYKFEFVLRCLNLSPSELNYKIREIEDYLKICLSRLENFKFLLQKSEMELKRLPR